MSEDSTATKNPVTCQADFTYSITPKTLVIKDTGRGKKSVVEDLPTVLRRIEHWHQESVAPLPPRVGAVVAGVWTGALFQGDCPKGPFYATASVLTHRLSLGPANESPRAKQVSPRQAAEQKVAPLPPARSLPDLHRAGPPRHYLTGKEHAAEEALESNHPSRHPSLFSLPLRWDSFLRHRPQSRQFR